MNQQLQTAMKLDLTLPALLPYKKWICSSSQDTALGSTNQAK